MIASYISFLASLTKVIDIIVYRLQCTVYIIFHRFGESQVLKVEECFALKQN